LSRYLTKGEDVVNSSPKVVAGLAMQLAGFAIMIVGGILLPGKTGTSCTVERVAARLCSPDQQQGETIGMVLAATGAIIFFIGYWLDKTGRRV
jgi:hypothetical protein